MIFSSLQPALDFAEAHKVPRVLEMRCPQCKQTIYGMLGEGTFDFMAHRAGEGK